MELPPSRSRKRAISRSARCTRTAAHVSRARAIQRLIMTTMNATVRLLNSGACGPAKAFSCSSRVHDVGRTTLLQPLRPHEGHAAEARQAAPFHRDLGTQGRSGQLQRSALSWLSFVTAAPALHNGFGPVVQES